MKSAMVITIMNEIDDYHDIKSIFNKCQLIRFAAKRSRWQFIDRTPDILIDTQEQRTKSRREPNSK